MKELRAWFAADMPLEVVPFAVAGQPCELHLRPMNDSQRDRFEMMGMRLAQQVEAGTVTDDAANKLKRYLVEHTLVNWVIRKVRKTVTDGETVVAEELPQKPSERESALRSFTADPEAFEWLVEECKRVNGYLEPEAGNSPPPCAN